MLDPGYLRKPVNDQPVASASGPVFSPDLGGLSLPASRLRLYLLVATWCPNCARELPHLRWLRDRVPGSELQMVGLPADPAETEIQLREFAGRNDLPYLLVPTVTSADRARLSELFGRDLAGQPLPAAVVTDTSGAVLYAGGRLPTLSDIAGFLGR